MLFPELPGHISFHFVCIVVLRIRPIALRGRANKEVQSAEPGVATILLTVTDGLQTFEEYQSSALIPECNILALICTYILNNIKKKFIF